MVENQSEVMEIALQAGHILLENGAEISRVEETIDRICRHYGVENGQAFVLSNGIFATAGGAGEQYFAKVQHIPVSGTHLNRVAAVNQLSREIEEGRYTPAQVRACLEDIRRMPGKSRGMQIFASGVGSSCFCLLFGGGAPEMVAAFAAGFLLYVYILYFSSKHLSKIMANITGAALVAVLCILLHHGMELWGTKSEISHMIIGAVIPMVPGVAFTNGIRDIADGDYIAGSVRMLDALLVFVCIAMGVGLVFAAYSRLTGGMIL